MRYPNLEVEVDPFADLPKDQDVPMDNEVLFDNSPKLSPPAS